MRKTNNIVIKTVFKVKDLEETERVYHLNDTQ